MQIGVGGMLVPTVPTSLLLLLGLTRERLLLTVTIVGNAHTARNVNRNLSFQPYRHVAALAANGTLFTDFHTGQSFCAPSRTAFMTGKFPGLCARVCLYCVMVDRLEI